MSKDKENTLTKAERREKVIIEESVVLDGKKYYAGLSSNYLKVHIESQAALKAGTLCYVALYADSGTVFGTLM